jgi:3-hydroxyisobutyrate dehydrogenase
MEAGMADDAIAFVGLGAMGLPMAKRLVAAGHGVRAFDLNTAALEVFAASGANASVAASAREAADGASAIVLMVVNAAQAEAVLIEAGALEALAPRASVILMATCAPSAVAALAARVNETQRRFVDAPVSGGVVGAQAGALTIMVGAPDEAFAATRALLGAMGDKIFHVGQEPGQGAAMKTVNQLLCGVHIASAAEGLALAQKAGIAPALALEILSGSAASSWMLKNRGPRMLEDDPQVTSAVDIFVKDLGIVLDAGRAGKAALPLAAAAHQLFLAASARGLGTADDSQVIEVYRALMGLEGA